MEVEQVIRGRWRGNKREVEQVIRGRWNRQHVGGGAGNK